MCAYILTIWQVQIIISAEKEHSLLINLYSNHLVWSKTEYEHLTCKNLT